MSLLYSLIFCLGLLITSPYWLYRAIIKKELSLTNDRLGFTSWNQLVFHGNQVSSADLLVHAVSIGEVRAAVPLVNSLTDNYPDLRVAVTTTTRTGLSVSKNAFEKNNNVIAPLQYPLDLPWAVNRRLREVNPKNIVFMETEIWPNMIYQSASLGIGLFMVNGRISDSSFPRYLMLRIPLTNVLRKFKRFYMQSELDAERIIAMGAPKDLVMVTGNLKIDSLLNESKTSVSGETRNTPSAPMLLAASTHPGEEEAILSAANLLKESGIDFRLAIAPRHPERAESVKELIRKYGFSVSLRSSGASDAINGSVLLIDTVGELSHFYPRSRVVFVGGSFGTHGGQNILEPAVYSRPVLFGPDMHNFREAESVLLGSGGTRVSTPAELPDALKIFLIDGEKANVEGSKARATLDDLAGATDRVIGDLGNYIS